MDNLIEKLTAKANEMPPIEAKVKFKVDDHVIFVDGTGGSNVISYDDLPADCVISTSAETLQKLKNGKLNPTMAVMMGKVKIKGDFGIAMKLQSLLS